MSRDRTQVIKKLDKKRDNKPNLLNVTRQKYNEKGDIGGKTVIRVGHPKNKTYNMKNQDFRGKLRKNTEHKERV